MCISARKSCVSASCGELCGDDPGGTATVVALGAVVVDERDASEEPDDDEQLEATNAARSASVAPWRKVLTA